MNAAEMGDLGRLPALQPVMPGHRLDDPDVDGKGLEAPAAVQQDAVRDFFANAGQQAQAGARLPVGQRLRCFQPTRMGGKKPGGLVDMAGAKTELARAQPGFGHAGEPIPGRREPLQAVPGASRATICLIWVIRLAELHMKPSSVSPKGCRRMRRPG